jgi:hypothetical protein
MLQHRLLRFEHLSPLLPIRNLQHEPLTRRRLQIEILITVTRQPTRRHTKPVMLSRYPRHLFD